MRVIGLIADTHIPARADALPVELVNGLAGVDMIIHAGDIVHASVLNALSEIAPVTAVAGNMDPPELHARLGRAKTLSIGRYTIGVIHGDGVRGTTSERALAAFPNTDCIVFGHSHQPLVERAGRVLLVNPGSPTDRRRWPYHSYGILYVSDRRIEARIIRLED
ncbi:metallophosphoesterase family protein [Desulforudis sp. 1088]|uniref:metallophosphoesterase family protein n=1 Tax=unclassified Candidatus Desulforudis TaxID=2635950 RepID=UPI003CE4AD8B